MARRARAHGFGGYSMPVCKDACQLSPHQPARKKVAQRAKRQFVLDAVLQPASHQALRNNQMRMLPAAKRARSLHVTELPPFDVVAMFETPARAEQSQVNPHRSAIATANSRRPFNGLNSFPRRRQTFQRARLCMPTKHPLRACLNSRSGDKQIRPRPIPQTIHPAHLAHCLFRTREANRRTGRALCAIPKAVATGQFCSCVFLYEKFRPAP